jgi:hypothetical protein
MAAPRSVIDTLPPNKIELDPVPADEDRAKAVENRAKEPAFLDVLAAVPAWSIWLPFALSLAVMALSLAVVLTGK